MAPYICSNCYRSYKIKGYYDKHISACALLHKSNKERREDDEPIPDHSQMYDMILVLVEKNKKLESKIDELSKWANIKKKQVHVKEWLDENYPDNITFDALVKNIEIDLEQYYLFCEQDYIDGCIMIIKSLLPLSELPIKAFDQKPDIFYIHTLSGWKTMQPNELERALTMIERKLMTHFVKWQNTNKHRMHNESYISEYTTILQKVIGGNFTKTQTYSKIRKKLYKHLKVNLKNIIEIDFMF
jgi:hypothetical protein